MKVKKDDFYHFFFRSTELMLFTSFVIPAGFYDVPRVLIVDVRSCSGFGRHLRLCDTLSLDVMLVSIRCQTRYIHTYMHRYIHTPYFSTIMLKANAYGVVHLKYSYT